MPIVLHRGQTLLALSLPFLAIGCGQKEGTDGAVAPAADRSTLSRPGAPMAAQMNAM
jgi:hypothetical protein